MTFMQGLGDFLKETWYSFSSSIEKGFTSFMKLLFNDFYDDIFPNSHVEAVIDDEGLNVGSYNEVIYLNNEEDGVSDALSINLNVLGEQPDWEVNPSDYLYSMAIFGKMRFNNLFSSDEGDILAAFDGGTCIGLTTSTYNADLDMWYALLTVFSNETQQDGIEFRMWDASTGITYQALPETPISFNNEAILGSPLLPIVFNGMQIMYQDIALSSGWSWISFNLDNENLNDVNETMSNGTWTSNDQIKTGDYIASYSTVENRWIGNLSDNGGFSTTSMYLVYSSDSQILSTYGTATDIDALPINVEAGERNYIGYLPRENYTVKQALAAYEGVDGDIIKSQRKFAMRYGNNWVGNLSNMEPNKGYMLFNNSSENKVFTYPSFTTQLKSIVAYEEPENIVQYADYPNSMSIIAQVDEDQLALLDHVYATVDGEIRGVDTQVTIDGKVLLFIPISGNSREESLVTFSMVQNEEVLATSTTAIQYNSDAVHGSIQQPINLKFNKLEENVLIYPTR